LYIPNAARTVRVRATAAEVNAGITLVPAVAGYQHRIVDATMIAVAGNATTADSVDIASTQGASGVLPVVNAAAALTQSARVSAGEAPAAGSSTILADGASFALNDANTAITLEVGGSDLTVATHVDVILTYVSVRV
jgi:hypothetical protein